MDLDRETAKAKAAHQKLTRIQAELKSAEIEVSSPDRSITVTVTTTGMVQNLRLANSILDRHDEISLERALFKTIRGAQEAAMDITEQAMRNAFPDYSLRTLGFSDSNSTDTRR